MIWLQLLIHLFNLKLCLYILHFSVLEDTLDEMDLATICVSCQVSWKLWFGLFQFTAFSGIGHNQTQLSYPSKQYLIKLHQPRFLPAICSQALLVSIDLYQARGAIHLNVVSVRSMATCASNVSNDFQRLQRTEGKRLSCTRETQASFDFLKNCGKIYVI